MTATEIIASAHPGMVFEAHPSRSWLWGSEHYQVSAHGQRRYSVQCFGADGRTRDESIIRYLTGYRQLGSNEIYSTPEQCAAVIFAEFAEIAAGAGWWLAIEQEFRVRV